MRLEKIKLAGFKSFVDPTTVLFPSNLVGVVGPNGCGKSNVIDAVRWVMGESSAKMLRGESMADVIFNGSSARKPVGTATIELIFDNGDGGAGGQYAQYTQISVKRQASRDGQSLYFLNGVRCRRRDITGLFLGTGLGPRSYSIIEQGMISRIIEARPEELRVYLEEAAGISKYKERRRETENRIGRTRENLERLNDLREEVQKQLRHLERQAATAEKYKELKQQERRTRAELLTLRLTQMVSDIDTRDKAIAEQETRLQSVIAEQRNVEAEIEEQRVSHTEYNDKFNQIQGRFYALGSDIARLEEAIQYARESRRQQEVDLQQAEKALAESQSLNQHDQSKLAQLADELERDQPRLEEAQMIAEQANEALQLAEQAMQDWQTGWDSFNQRANEPAQQAQVERTRINHLEQQEQQLKGRVERNQEEQQRLSDVELQAEIVELQRREDEAAAGHESARETVQEQVLQIEGLRESTRNQQDELAASRGELETVRGRLASLHALQQAALGEDDKTLNEWLGDNGLAAAKRLLESVEVDGRWQQAAEIVLGHHLQAVLVEDLSEFGSVLPGFDNANLDLFEMTQDVVAARPGTMASVVQGPAGLIAVLNSVHLVDDIDTAMSRRGALAIGESLITPDGILIGSGWLHIHRAPDASSGVLAREQDIRLLSMREQELAPRVEELTESLDAGRQALTDAERRRNEQLQQQEAAGKILSDLRALLSGKRARAEQVRHRIEALALDAEELRMQMQSGIEEMETARIRLHEALGQIENLATQREQLVGQRERLRHELDEMRQKGTQARNQVHEIALRVESMRSSESSLRSGVDRMQLQVQQAGERCERLRDSLENSMAPIGEQQAQLERQLVDRVTVEGQLSDARKQLESIDHRLRELEQTRHQIEQKVQDERGKLDQGRMARQEVVVRSRTLEEQLQETGFTRAELTGAMPEEATIQHWQQNVERLATRIQRLGPINLAAIDEFKEQGERMEYLDRQHEDVTRSLDTLEEAIRKIDRETRTRFKETFDRVDAGFKQLFPKLFGGGHAYLELTGEDLLDTGVTVMARPPGKRNSSIYLLSGGEKALTAVALVFSIFQLNPAPFCMLDEVDAPLDDANVARYSRLVKEMSEHVQFIFITHNKVTMEIANQLSGVTMHEPGVSRLVSVDVEEAAALAAI